MNLCSHAALILSSEPKSLIWCESLTPPMIGGASIKGGMSMSAGNEQEENLKIIGGIKIEYKYNKYIGI